MKTKITSVFWGLILILGGALFLAVNLGYISGTSPTFWMAVFAGLGGLFLITYFLNGVQHWGWLFPALILGALALTIGLSEAGVQDSLTAAPILVSVALPFVVAFALKPRERWWALIPAWVMLAVTGIVLLSDRLEGELMGTFVLYTIALPFFVVFFVNRANRWALIPGGILAVVGLFPLLATRLNGSLMGAAVLLLIALPFLLVFFWSRRNWWALIPAGILGGIGAGLLLLGSGPEIESRANLMNGLMFIVWAVAFGVLWLLRSSRPTAWAKYPAVVMAVIGVVILALGASTGIILPLLLVAGGLVILVVNLLPKKAQ
jgi:hypothetical protein